MSVAAVALFAVVATLLTPAASVAVPDALKADLAQAKERLAALDATAGTAVEDYDEAKAHLDDLQAQLAATRTQVTHLQDAVTRKQQLADDYVRSLYRMGPGLQLQTLLSSDGPTEAGVRAATMARLTQQQLDVIHELARQRSELERARVTLADQTKQAAQREQELAQRRDAVEHTLAAQRDEVNQLTARIAEAERREAAARARAEAEARARAEAAAKARREAAKRARDEAAQAARDEVPTTRGSASAAVDAAMSQVGKPYRWGAAGPNAYDCSGLTMWAWRHAGVSLPHSSRMQYRATRRISRAQLQPGDLVFFGHPIHHVAMYIGNGKVVEAPYSGEDVRVNASAMDRSDIVGYGRP